MSRVDHEGVPIVQRSYDLCVGLYAHVHRFPRAERALLGRVILDDALQMLTVLTVATRRASRAESLAEASGRLDALRITLRLSKRLGFLSNRGYEELTEVADEIGRMLGGWLKHESTEGGNRDGDRARARASGQAGAVERTPASGVDCCSHGRGATPSPGAKPKPRRGGVRYTMSSPTIERYLRLKLEHPGKIVFVTVGAFCQTFFEDAAACGRELRVGVRNVAAESEQEKILTCGIPKGKLEQYVLRLRHAGREVHVE